MRTLCKRCLESIGLCCQGRSPACMPTLSARHRCTNPCCQRWPHLHVTASPATPKHVEDTVICQSTSISQMIRAQSVQKSVDGIWHTHCYCTQHRVYAGVALGVLNPSTITMAHMYSCVVRKGHLYGGPGWLSSAVPYQPLGGLAATRTAGNGNNKKQQT